MSIQITITANNANEAVQLVHDLAGTMTGMNPADIPAKTEDSTVEQAPQATPVPVQTELAHAPLNTAPTAVPTAPVAPTQPQQMQPGTVPTTTQTYTFDQLAVAATQLMDAKRDKDLHELLSQFGIRALMELPKEQYGVFATKLRELGVKI